MTHALEETLLRRFDGILVMKDGKVGEVGTFDELMKEKEKAEHALEEKMNRWVYLNDLAEKIESQKG